MKNFNSDFQVWFLNDFEFNPEICHIFYASMCGSRGGGGGGGGGVAGGPESPEKSQKYRVSSISWKYWSGSPKKLQNYQASIQCSAIIGTPAKRHLNGVSLAGR